MTESMGVKEKTVCSQDHQEINPKRAGGGGGGGGIRPPRRFARYFCGNFFQRRELS